MKKGFTLVELLAVIIILAVIAVIATPVVLNIINEAKENLPLKSAQLYIDGVDQSILSARLDIGKIENGTYSIMEDGNICIGEFEDNTCDGNILKMEIKGDYPTKGTVKIKDNNVERINITINDKNIWTEPFTGKLEYKLAPGLYDANDKLLASWDELVKDYDFENLVIAGENLAAEVIDSIVGASKLVMLEGVTYIGSDAFAGCESLTSVIIPGSVTDIYSNAFYDCTSLTNVIIEEGVTYIGGYVFAGCESLTSVIIPGSVTVIDSNAFYDCTSLTNVIIEEGVTYIGSDAFGECTSLTSITIPGSVTDIDICAFAECTSLTNVIIEEGVREIRSGAFFGCTSLTSITIPGSVTVIESIFYGCDNLTTIYYKGIAPGRPWGAENATVVSNF